jgi:hypothetical protein
MSLSLPRPPALIRMHQRLAYLIVIGCIVLAGLACRHLGLPWLFAKYSGSILWGTMVYFIVAFFVPRAALFRKAAAACLIAVLIELIRLYHAPWLDAFRMTLPGELLLGRHFSLWDILAYWAGIALGGLGDEAAWKSRA